MKRSVHATASSGVDTPLCFQELITTERLADLEDLLYDYDHSGEVIELKLPFQVSHDFLTTAVHPAPRQLILFTLMLEQFSQAPQDMNVHLAKLFEEHDIDNSGVLEEGEVASLLTGTLGIEPSDRSIS
jgi:hypothetical protein